MLGEHETKFISNYYLNLLRLNSIVYAISNHRELVVIIQKGILVKPGQ